VSRDSGEGCVRKEDFKGEDTTGGEVEKDGRFPRGDREGRGRDQVKNRGCGVYVQCGVWKKGEVQRKK